MRTDNVNQTKKLDRHKKIIEILSKDKIIKLYKIYLNLTEKEKDNLEKKWKQYYIDVLKTEEYLDYKKQREALKRGDLFEVKRIAEKQRYKLKTGNYKKLKKPSSIDPVELTHHYKIIQYNSSLRVINEIENEETRNVYKYLF